MSKENLFKVPVDFIKTVRYEKEKSRYFLALFGITPIILLIVAIIIGTGGMAILFIGFYALLIWFFIWFIGKIVKAILLMNLVEVNNKNFNHLFELIKDASKIMEYTHPIQTYVWKGSKIGLVILHHLDKKIFLINSSFLENKPSNELLMFKVMFHIARLKTRSEYFSLLTSIISGIEKIWMLNIFLYPFERATVYTADRIAMVYSGNLDIAQQALVSEIVGNELEKNININAIMEQGEECKGFFAWLARAYSSFPGYSHRLVELNKFYNENTDLLMKRHQS